MDSSRRPGSPPTATPSRRRGAVLEHAILEAALAQLGTVGWSALTMEGVAAEAHTGKAAIYRRWPSKEDLVADALRVALPMFHGAPDLGGVRDDLLNLCLRMREVMYSRSGMALRSVIHECDAEAAGRFHSVIDEGVVEPAARLIKEVISRGVERGEVRPEALDDYVCDVIPALMMYRSKMCASEWTEGELTRMIDRVMVPLLRPTDGWRQRS
ncbi:TetR/AcrR family transcriptional regulator [Streptomyces uncialis]|uniref:TetR/AcrR family transcriptional regulator n=1 Tax=Streptomyces uncialis TaxID=1048205 RepID=UPI0033E64517